MERPDPDKLLARVKQATEKPTRGRLKIFFGASAGVGKTYAMLEAAQQRRAEGIDVVVGYVEPHGRVETEALLDGLEQIPPRSVEYHGTQLREFDLDGALARQPQLILVDELAHTNVAGSRHAKRWQDVAELLAVGIDVYTTVNVQHIESLNDVVAQIAGVVVRETVPDQIIDAADEVELIDLTPDDLLQRLKEGKVYVPQQAQRALTGFFRKGNLIALRELALRRTAERVDAQMEDYRRDHAIANPWPAAVRLLVGVGGSESPAQLVRAARRIAAGMRAEWTVAYVETPRELRRAAAEREQTIQALRLAEQLGATTTILIGANVADELLTYSRSRNISKIIVGKPGKARWREVLSGSITNSLMRSADPIDVYVLGGERETPQPDAPAAHPATSPAAYGWSVAIVVACTVLLALVEWLFPAFAEANLIMTYLLGVLIVAVYLGRGPAILASLLSVLAFDFFSVPPYLTFAISDTQYLATFAVMLVVALVISNLTARFRQQAETARQRERRTAALYALSRDLASVRGTEELLRVTVRHVFETFESRAVVLLPIAPGKLQPWGSAVGWARSTNAEQIFAPDAAEQGVAQWVYDHSQMAGLGTSTLPSAKSLYLPLVASQQTVGVLGTRPSDPQRFQTPEQLHLLETFANQAALAFERALLAAEAEQALVTAETERLRASLLSSVSHDLRTPLAVISGASSTLLESGETLTAATRDDLARTIVDEAGRLNRLLGNLLEMTRIEAGGINVQKEWQPIEEVVGAALARVEANNPDRSITTLLPADLPLVPIDATLIEQVLINLLDNAVKHTPVGTPIELRATASNGAIVVEVADRGPGLPPGDEQRVFDKFYRAQPSDTRGVGLGLAIAHGMVEAHGGRIWAENRPHGGAVFRFTLPTTADIPALALRTDP